MSLILCTKNCLYQKDGYCKLDQAAEITSAIDSGGCLHYKSKDVQTPSAQKNVYENPDAQM